jgi:hypothetical protein
MAQTTIDKTILEYNIRLEIKRLYLSKWSKNNGIEGKNGDYVSRNE